jgi:hypothetical protein
MTTVRVMRASSAWLGAPLSPPGCPGVADTESFQVQPNYGVSLRHPCRATRDAVRAARGFMIEANQGYAVGESDYAVCHRSRVGTRPDFAARGELFRLAVESGHATAQLGCEMGRHGETVFFETLGIPRQWLPFGSFSQSKTQAARMLSDGRLPSCVWSAFQKEGTAIPSEKRCITHPTLTSAPNTATAPRQTCLVVAYDIRCAGQCAATCINRYRNPVSRFEKLADSQVMF